MPWPKSVTMTTSASPILDATACDISSADSTATTSGPYGFGALPGPAITVTEAPRLHAA